MRTRAKQPNEGTENVSLDTIVKLTEPEADKQYSALTGLFTAMSVEMKETATLVLSLMSCVSIEDDAEWLSRQARKAPRCLSRCSQPALPPFSKNNKAPQTSPDEK